MVEQVYYHNSHTVPDYEYVDEEEHDYYEEEYHHHQEEGPYIPPQPRGLPVFKIKSEIIPELGGVSQNFGGDVKDFTHWGGGGGFDGRDHLEHPREEFQGFGQYHRGVETHFSSPRRQRYPRYPPQFDYDAPEINPVIRDVVMINQIIVFLIGQCTG